MKKDSIAAYPNNFLNDLCWEQYLHRAAQRLILGFDIVHLDPNEGLISAHTPDSPQPYTSCELVTILGENVTSGVSIQWQGAFAFGSSVDANDSPAASFFSGKRFAIPKQRNLHLYFI